jgi:hypothetical protein
MSFTRPMFWLTFAEFMSVSVSMYGLVLFYVVVHDDISEHKPLAKFIVVKFVIFFSFWQAVAISMGVSMGLIEETESYTTANIATSIQSFLVCVEMLIAAIMHKTAFSYEPFIPNEDRSAKTPLLLGKRQEFLLI